MECRGPTHCHYSQNLLAAYHLKRKTIREHKVRKKSNTGEKKQRGGTRRSEENEKMKKSTHESTALYPVVI